MAPELYGELGRGELDGFARQRGRQRAAGVASAVQLVADVRQGRVPYYLLMEALSPRTPAVVSAIARNYPGIINLRESMTTSDFPLLMGDVMDRMMLARWREFPAAWRSFMAVGTRRDFRSGHDLAFDGLEGQWHEQAETEELKYGSMTEAEYTYAVKVYSLGARLSWKMIVNDDLDAFGTIPDRLGRGGARTVAKFAAGLYVDANGPHASLYNAGNGNIVLGNPALSISALQTAYGMMRSMKDSEGEPIMVESAWLVVPPELEVVARNILQATQVLLTTAGGVSGQEMQVANWIGTSLNLAVDPYISIIAAGAIAAGEYPWFLFANPTVARPALKIAFLRGFEEPQLYQKLANTARIGGGIDQEAGDFNTMAQEYKGVTAFGGTRVDPKSTIASDGSGVIVP